MCGINVGKLDSICQNSKHWKNVSLEGSGKKVRKFVVTNSTHAKCEEIADGRTGEM